MAACNVHKIWVNVCAHLNGLLCTKSFLTDVHICNTGNVRIHQNVHIQVLKTHCGGGRCAKTSPANHKSTPDVHIKLHLRGDVRINYS